MRKRLGQHFLYNQKVLRRIVDALYLQAGDTVIEIGPGRGALTRMLVESCKLKVDRFRIIGIEKDAVLVDHLARKFEIRSTKFETISKSKIQNSKLILLEGDALKVLPEIIRNLQLTTKNYKLVGNIPYYITGKLFRVVGDLQHKPEVAVFMVQKEVAERVSAKAPHMNLLAASVQAWAEAEYLFSVSRREFRPMPKVESAVIKLKVVRCTLTEQQRDDYYKFIKILFKQPRKTILNNLSEGLRRPKGGILPILNTLGLDERSRPQILSIKLITKLREML